MVSFDIKSYFTPVRLIETLYIILGRVCNPKEILTVLTKNEMRKLSAICTTYISH